MRRLFAPLAFSILLLTTPSAGQAPQRPPAPAPAQPTAPATVVPVSVNGDSAARFVLVVMSDGYTAADMP